MFDLFNAFFRLLNCALDCCWLTEGVVGYTFPVTFMLGKTKPPWVTLVGIIVLIFTIFIFVVFIVAVAKAINKL